MRNIMIKIGALCLALALTGCAAACSETGKQDAVVTRSDSEVDEAPFVRGVWAADDGQQRTGYYLFTDGHSGAYLDTERAIGVGFDVDMVNGERVDFHMGAADVNDYAALKVSGEGQRTLTWEYDKRVENLTLLTDANPDDFTFYAAADLGEAALADYADKNGSQPEYVGYVVHVDGTVDIQLYDEVDGHNSTAAYYQIDSLTGKGQNVTSGEAVDFSR